MGVRGDPPLTDQLQGQDTVWHRPLDVIGAGGCVVISCQKVALGEGKYLFIPPALQWISPCSEIQGILSLFLSLALETEPIKGKGCRMVFRFLSKVRAVEYLKD